MDRPVSVIAAVHRRLQKSLDGLIKSHPRLHNAVSRVLLALAPSSITDVQLLSVKYIRLVSYNFVASLVKIASYSVGWLSSYSQKYLGSNFVPLDSLITLYVNLSTTRVKEIKLKTVSNQKSQDPKSQPQAWCGMQQTSN